MAIIRVRSYNVKKGIEYDGLVPEGNGFWLTEKVRYSVNRSPMAHDKVFDPIMTKPSYRYSFEKDTNIMLLNIANTGGNPFYKADSMADVDIASGTESAAIVTLTAPQAGTECTISARFMYDNLETGQNANVTIRLKKGGTVIASHVADVARKSTEGVGVEIIGQAITVGDIFTITCESNKTGEVKGSVLPSIIQYEIRTL